ncbi:hypothetical protein [Dyella sp. 2RAB6]
MSPLASSIRMLSNPAHAGRMPLAGAIASSATTITTGTGTTGHGWVSARE